MIYDMIASLTILVEEDAIMHVLLVNKGNLRWGGNYSLIYLQSTDRLYCCLRTAYEGIPDWIQRANRICTLYQPDIEVVACVCSDCVL